MNRSFGSLLKERRLKTGLTMRQLAQQMGCAASFIAELENGRRLPPKDISVLEKLGKTLKVGTKELARLSERERVKPQEDKKVMNFFKTKGDLAFVLCREAQRLPDQELEKIIRNIKNGKI